MQYTHTETATTLDHDYYRDYEYLIVNLGRYPASYINVPENHKYYNGEFWNMKIKPHSDLSFGGSLERYHLEGFWIGWEYNLFGDYVLGRSREFIPEGWHHQYTTAEIVEKVRKVIDQLIEMEERR